MATSCKSEFQLKHFGFNSVREDLFYHLQWTRNRWVFFSYRFFVAAYCLGWFLYAYIVERNPVASTLLSNWTEGVMVVYFLYAFFIAIYAVTNRNKPISHNSDSKLPWYCILNWLLYTVATTSALEISLFYAVTIAPGRTAEENLMPITVHLHITNSILLLIDVFMVAFPDRFFHFVYTVLYGILYLVFILILHFTGFNSQVYSVLDFENSPGTAAGWSVLAVLVIPFVFHTILFGLYHLRAFIAGKTLGSDEATYPSSDGRMEMGNVNPTFDDAEK